MLCRVLILGVALLLAPTASQARVAPQQEPVRVMIVGVFHFANPGQDINNVETPPMTGGRRQEELAEVGRRLATFRPNAIALERVADNADLLDQEFLRHRPGDYTASADERLQLGYRIADAAGVRRVYAIDEKAEDGQASYFPVGPLMAWLEERGQQDRFAALNAPIAQEAAALSRRLKTESMATILADINRPDHRINIAGQGAGYYQLLRFGAGEVQPGAELNGRWYTRNAYIFAKLFQVAQPGDRILVVFGAGHSYWLRHFVETTPGFELVEATPWLAD